MLRPPVHSNIPLTRRRNTLIDNSKKLESMLCQIHQNAANSPENQIVTLDLDLEENVKTPLPNYYVTLKYRCDRITSATYLSMP